MGRLSLARTVARTTLLNALERRGAVGSAWHAGRRLGALAGTALVGPEVVQITPMTYTCNHTCPMCWLQHTDPDELSTMRRRERREHLSLADYEALFDGMLPGLREVVMVGGGEPLAFREATEVARSIKRRRWRGTLVTNGTLLTDEVAAALVGMRWDTLRVSVHAGDRETYARVQGVDRFDVLRENLLQFDRRRRAARVEKVCALSVYHVLQPANVRSVDRLFAFAAEVGADEVVFELVKPLNEDLRLDPAELARAAEALVDGARTSRVRTTLPQPAALLAAGRPAPARAAVAAAAGAPAEPDAARPGRRCIVGFDQTFIDSFGLVKPCCYSTEILGNVREQPFHSIWHGPRYASFRRRLIDGQFADYCRGCTLPSVLNH
jgi:MoaA/NifB/PqqE/SkfB family radical SAM enzyme